jgi:hypothetical protein
MKTVAEYRHYAEQCRKLAAEMSKPEDKKAVQVMAAAWEKVADQREAALRKEEPPELL